jgi:L-rhamnono-1,4-lactonase
MPPFPIVDSHIHLFPSTHLSTLAWWTPDSPLNGQHSVSEYKNAVSHSPVAQSLRGFIFIETDRISSTTPEDWTHVEQELLFLLRIVNGRPIAGEGHDASDKNLCLGIVPWAPVPAGREVMGIYLQMVFNSTGSMWGKVKGFRYLVQDKKCGTMITKEFGEGLDLLGEKGLVFDLGIDVRQAGLWQLKDALAMVSGIVRRSEGKEEKMVTIVISMSGY